MAALRWPLVASLCLSLAACTPPQTSTEIHAETTEAATPWTGLTANDADGEFHFVIVADRTGNERRGIFPAAMPKVNLLEPAFVVSVGDLIEGYTEDQAELDRQWDEFDSFIETLETPFFHVAGNHDMSNALMAETWRSRFGPSFYHFTYKGVLFLALNSELFGMVNDPKTPVPGPWTQADQLAYVKRTLEAHPNPRWTIILVHQPLWDYGDHPRGDWPKVEEMLEGREYTVFAGHFHRYKKQVRNGRKYITLAAAGGGSSLRGAPYGEFDQVAWVTMTEEGPRLANLMLDGIFDENVATAESRGAVDALTAGIASVTRFQAGSAFEAGAVAFDISNPNEAKLRVTPHVAPGESLRYLGGAAPMVIAPGASRRVELKFAADQPVPWGQIVPTRIDWSLSTSIGERPLAFTVASAALPVAAVPLPSFDAPNIDGHLSDWPDLPYLVQHQGDVTAPPLAPADLSYRFGIREAEGDVYFGVHVTDDSLAASASESPRFQDHVWIAVDARPEPHRSGNKRLLQAYVDGDLPRIATDYMTIGDAAEDKNLAFLAEARAVVEWRTQRTEAGYNAEARVSGTFLNKQSGGSWEALRISLAVADADAGEPQMTTLHWQPDRFGEAPVAGSGTFLRSGAPSAGAAHR